MTDGAIDNEFDDAEKDPRDVLRDARADLGPGPHRDHDQMGRGDVAVDLVTRQTVYIARAVAGSLPEYYAEEEFDLYNYKMHPYLPVSLDDTVYECVYVGGVKDLHNFSGTYSFPEGRLARVPVELAGDGE
ncbi:hypothetical protein SAMN05216388_1017128 [Halorientalis persicus]|uniref:Uncharacterized protein n=1 Tax=Halorientalis persicus TaxID=1367881 RepID=A0A1H8S486_9EURY|nr:hypothetical protein [Halorientalis persicus]SEO72973.1 hypothetical protein SAMN05216388_1017128 [Halorientalis persicus]